MRLNTFKRYGFTADLYKYNITQDPTGGEIRTYYLDRQGLKCDVLSDGSSRLLFTFDDSDVSPGDRLEKVKDRRGVEVFVDGVYQLSTVEPQINIYKTRESYRSRGNLI